jgi:hypothetical protein
MYTGILSLGVERLEVVADQSLATIIKFNICGAMFQLSHGVSNFISFSFISHAD